MFKENKYVRYPDFFIDNRIVIDAKYKHLGYTDIARDDIHQIITYLHVLKAKGTYLAYPIDNNEESDIRNIGSLKGFGGEVGLIGLKIPQNASCLSDFHDVISKEEAIVINKLSQLICTQ